MAAVDSFEFLLREINKICSCYRDALALIGALYASRQTIKIVYCLLKTGNDHVLSKLSGLVDLRKNFGKWAGAILTCVLLYKFTIISPNISYCI